MKSSLVKIKKGDKIQYNSHINEWEDVIFLESILTPNGINDPKLISLIYAKRKNGNFIWATSDKFKVHDNVNYDEFYPSLHFGKIKIMKIQKEIDSQLYRKIMYRYFNLNEWPYLSNITCVKVFKQKDQIVIEIETYRPGLLIGRAGRFIDGLRDFIKKETNENIKISIKECMLWCNLCK